LLRCLPAVLYEAGVAVTVALAFTPELMESIAAVRQARRLRGIPTKGLRGLRGVAVPVLEGALDRSLQLATSMDARGYGRREGSRSAMRRLATAVTVLGLLLAAVGVYGVIDSGSLFGLGLPIITLAFVLCAVGMAVSGRRSTRTRYRPDPWGLPEWCVVASGLSALTAMLVARAVDVAGIVVSFQPLAVPALPLLPVVGILVAATPAFVVPAPRPSATRATTEVEAVPA
jgi:energy-coupling factor transport system permease protein